MTLHSQTRKQPYHLSVVALMLNDQNQIYCHYFQHFQHHGVMDGKPLDNFYHPMAESLEDDESPEQALHRGLMEEMGVTAKIEAYLGANEPAITEFGYTWYKTNLYYFCTIIEADASKRLADDPEAVSKPGWYDVETVMAAMKKTAERYDRPDSDYSVMIQRAIDWRHANQGE